MIKVNNVSMKYRMTFSRIKSLKEYIVSMLTRKLKYEDFWALENISFTVDKGEVVGIIGHNGAGKSTLLKIISGILKPTEGNVELMGRVVPMLELGSGFDIELSGRKNIFLNGAIWGREDRIVELTGNNHENILLTYSMAHKIREINNTANKVLFDVNLNFVDIPECEWGYTGTTKKYSIEYNEKKEHKGYSQPYKAHCASKVKRNTI